MRHRSPPASSVTSCFGGGRTPRRAPGPRTSLPTTIGEVSLDLREQDPAAARFNAFAQAVLFSLIGGVVGLITAGLLTGTGRPLGWTIVAVCTALGGVPLARWLVDRHRTDHVDLYGIDRSLRQLLVRAAASADAIEQAALAAPDGPISEQLFENHRSAVSHLHLMECDARRSGIASRQGLLQVCHQLDELAAASQRLAGTALAALPTVLGSLTERTLLIDQILNEQSVDDPTLLG